ncbi:hypothetical protein [Psychrobacter sp. LV10R520-6]|uniref:hypothetical protein n=1 Tax=Psychrobacter sp. LV10R520-6 TaxID=1415574 RepID=UPI0024C52B1E|nr:hypothetical protein [Psychrobacter sp. LV10R520-6]SNT69547.1 hypothetical protein SAMN04488491_0640 [Psychrobacter sp. LV10R520-6]
MSIKKEYHQALYGDIKVPEPLEIDVKVVVSDNQLEPTTTKTETPKLQRFYAPRP